MYASPEVLSTSKHGRASDIFSMGCVWLEMYTVLLGERLEDFEQDRLSPSESFSEELNDTELPELQEGFKSFAASLSRIQKWIGRLIVYCNVHGSLILRGAEKFPGLNVSCNEIIQGLHNVERMLQEDPSVRPDTRTLCQTLGANQCCETELPLVKVAECSPNPETKFEPSESATNILGTGSKSGTTTAPKHEDYTVGWICALPTEMAVAQGMLDERHDTLPSLPLDNNHYTFGRISDHNVVIACLPSGTTGTISAATVATQMLSAFTGLRFGLMVGIGGGVPSEEHDIRLGDVVVSKPTGTFGGVIQYDFGKTVQDGKFTRTGSLNKPPDVLLTALANLEAKHMMENHELRKYLSEMTKKYPRMRTQFTHPGQQDRLFEAEYDHFMGQPTCSQCDISRWVHREPRESDDPVIHYGLIASGDQVMKYGAVRDRLRRELDILCFEMEVAGLMDNFPCLVIRGICDYADSHRNKQWQPYAAATAAAYVKELLSVTPKSQVVNTRVAVETTEAGESYIHDPILYMDKTDWSMIVLSTKTNLSLIPFGRDGQFVGREDILFQVKEQLQIRHRVSLHGLGGIGYISSKYHFTQRC
jgi:nucleoside phosphorylase